MFMMLDVTTNKNIGVIYVIYNMDNNLARNINMKVYILLIN